MTVSDNDVSAILRAFSFSAVKHDRQRRKGGAASPYINHLIDVADRLWNTGGIRDIRPVLAAILHDTVEDTGTTMEELESEFGEDVAAIVLEVTDDKSLPEAERKRLQVERAGDLSYHARLVKIADKISNIHDILESPPVNWSRERRLAYIGWAEQVIDRIRGTNKPLERYFDDLIARGKESLGNS